MKDDTEQNVRDRGQVFGLPAPLVVVIVLLSALTLYQQIMLPFALKTTQAELVSSVADRNQVATSSNTSVTQSQALAKQLEALGYKPVVDRADIPKIVDLKPGPSGPQGVPGLNGLNGLNGAQGQIGPMGPTGPIGPQGLQGKPGPYPQCMLAATKCIGAVGPTGETGPVGERGAQGETGDTGPAGERGETGAQGETGATGATGAQGETGARGATGIKGDNGRGIVSGPTCTGDGAESYWLTEYSDGVKVRQDGPCRTDATTPVVPNGLRGN
jgi:hypothetical protein